MLRHIILGVIALSLFQSCSSDSSSSGTAPNPKGKQKTCIDESELLQSGIVGGTQVYQNDLDAKKVMLLFAVGQETGTCTASAISSKVLVTAAHCIKGDVSRSFVVLHSSISCESGFDARANTVSIREFIVHPQYKSGVSHDGYNKNDIALIILEEPLPYSYMTHKIADPNRIDLGSTIQFLGYGSTSISDKGNNGTGILRTIELSSNSYTIDQAKKNVEMDQSHGQGICTGDSGGPGLVRVQGQQQILGINSYVEGRMSADCNYKSHLLLAHPYIGWIKERLNARNIYWNN